MVKSEFYGIYPYLVSPVGEDGTVLERPLRELVSHLIGAGVHGLTPLGSTGEFFYLSREQKKRIAQIVIDEARGRVPVVVGVDGSNLPEARRYAREMEDLGADGILSVMNVYFPVSQEEVYRYFAGVAESVDCPVVLYNNPKFTGFKISVDTLTPLSEVPNILYYKDASGNTGELLNVYNHVGDRMKIFSASAHIPVSVMLMGGVGWMSGPACLIPRESVRLYELCKESRWEEAMALQRILWEVNHVFQTYNLAACVKAGLRLQGFAVGDPVAPRAALPPEACAEVGAAVERVRKKAAPFLERS